MKAKIIRPSYQILAPTDLHGDGRRQILEAIERAGRTCYRSETAITEGSASRFVSRIVRNNHEAMLEHASISVRLIVDRGVSHELVRHRMASFAQESTRYCNYSSSKFGDVIEFIDIEPMVRKTHMAKALQDGALNAWRKSCKASAEAYGALIACGAAPEIARSVLNNSVRTEIVVTANVREWRHIFKLRAVGTTGKPHPQMAEIMIPLMLELQSALPECFGDLSEPVK